MRRLLVRGSRMVEVLTQIIYREEQRSHCFPFARIHFNETLTIYFENEVIKNLVPTSDAAKISVCSWKLKDKIRIQVKRCRPLTQEILESDYEVLSFTNNTQYHDFFAFASAHHKNFRQTFEKMLNVAGLKMPSKVKCPIYQNHFSARADIYKNYVSSYLIPCMEVIKNDPEVNKLAMVDSNYSQLARNSAATGEYLKEKIGVHYYPLVPFLLERLFSVYCTNNKINVSYL